MAAGLAGAASSAPPDVDAVIELMPGSEKADAVQITDDAVYFVSYVNPPSPSGEPVATLYRRSLTATAGGHALAAPNVIDRIVPESSFAVHDGTIAYVRAVDGGLVLRASDGAETVPAWGDSPAMGSGVVDLSAEWLVVNESPYDPVYTLVDRQTGAEYDLGDTVTKPSYVAWLADHGRIEVTDTRAVFGLYSLESSTGGEINFTGVYTVALGPDGPVGPATVLREAGERYLDWWVDPVGIDGTRVLWTNGQCDGGDCGTAALWLDAPYSGPPSRAILGDVGVVGHDGSTLILVEYLPTMDRVSWVDPVAAPETVIRSVDLAGHVTAAHGSFVSYTGIGIGVEPHLVDAAGGTLTGDQTLPAPSMPFSDTRGGDPFTGEILWLYDRGVVGGFSDGTYRPSASVNRDAMAAFLYRIAHDGADAPACTTAAFLDVPSSHPFCGEITWLASTGITTGWPDGTFRPGTPVTREAMAAFLYRFAHDGAAIHACAGAPFVDVAVTGPFCGAIDWMAGAGISTGWPDGTFRPAASIERQAMAAFLFRVIDAGLVPGGWD